MPSQKKHDSNLASYTLGLRSRQQMNTRPFWSSMCSLLVTLLFVGVSGCSKDDHSGPPVPQDLPAKVSQDQGSRQAGQVPTNATTVVAKQHKLIQTAELHVEVTAYDEAKKAVDRLLAEHQGYVQTARLDHYEGRVSQAELVLRLPSEQLKNATDAVAQLGTVLHQQLITQDITEQYADLKARLHNARQLEARLLGLMSEKTKKVKELLEVERELARVREKIERFEAKQRLFDRQVAYSTLTLRLTTRQSFAAGPPRTLGEQLATTVGQSWQALSRFGRGLLVFTVAMLPWSPLLLLLGWLSRRGYRWTRRRLALAVPGGSAQVPVGSVVGPVNAVVEPTGSAPKPSNGVSQ